MLGWRLPLWVVGGCAGAVVVVLFSGRREEYTFMSRGYQSLDNTSKFSIATPVFQGYRKRYWGKKCRVRAPHSTFLPVIGADLIPPKLHRHQCSTAEYIV